VAASSSEGQVIELVEYVAETLDIGPGTTVFEVACGTGDFLLPLHDNGYLVGGLDRDPACIEGARLAMPGGRFTAGSPADLDPAQPWQVVICRAFDSLPDLDYARDVVARMAAKATHAVAILNVREDRFDRRWMLHTFAGLGVSAVQMEVAQEEGGEMKEARYNVFARL